MLETPRLKLVPLTHEQLLYFKHDQYALAEDLKINYLEPQQDPAVATDLAEAIEFWIKGTSDNPLNYRWFTNWLLLSRQEHVIVGGIGFAGLPDENGKSMVGYGLDVRYHNRGYATEALQAMVAWGFEHENLKTIIADSPLLNFPSHRVLEKNGFRESHRGPELVSWYLNRK